jgi:hypothetical protein
MALPYPDGAERVMDGDNAIGALATAIDSPLYRADFPVFAQGTAAAASAVAANGRIPMDTVTGNAAALVSNALRITAGNAGLYLAAFALSSNAGAAGSSVRCVLRVTGNTKGGVNPAVNATNAVRSSIVSILTLAVGDDVYVEATDAWSHQAYAFQLIRLGLAQGSIATALPAGLDLSEGPGLGLPED